MKKNKTNSVEISDKALLKEKVCYGIASTLFVVGAASFAATIGFGLAGALKAGQFILSLLASTIPTAAGFIVGTVGTPVERGIEEMPKQLPQTDDRNDFCK